MRFYMIQDKATGKWYKKGMGGRFLGQPGGCFCLDYDEWPSRGYGLDRTL